MFWLIFCFKSLKSGSYCDSFFVCTKTVFAPVTLIKSGNDTVVTWCSFCYGMMNQGLGPLTPPDQEQIKVKDIADIVAENLS